MGSEELSRLIENSVFAFRGYNITNSGLTSELFAQDRYRPYFERQFGNLGEIASDSLSQSIDLTKRASETGEATLETYPQEVAFIVAVELAHIDILKQEFGIDVADAKLLMGYSLGEVTAAICSGVFTVEAILPPTLKLAAAAAELAHTCGMGILFSRALTIDYRLVEKTCLEITAEGHGTIAISAYLSPNTVLLLGQNETLDRMKTLVKERFPKGTQLRKNPHQWPPLHTPIVRQKQIRDRGSVLLDSVTGGFTTPSPPILSCVTGEISYTDSNARTLLVDWIDHPQRLWSAVHTVLDNGLEAILHVGPEPNIIPATITRLQNNVTAQLSRQTWASLGLRAFSHLAARRRWLRNLISRDAALLRAPLIQQVNLEEWLLENRAI